MRIAQHSTDDAVLHELGARLERYRLQRNLTQRELAEQAGVEHKTVGRMESGEAVRVTSLIRVLRTLGLLGGLERLVPELGPSPIELLELHGKTRRRASGKRRRTPPARGTARGSTGEAAGEAATPWHWGDEAPTVE